MNPNAIQEALNLADRKPPVIDYAAPETNRRNGTWAFVIALGGLAVALLLLTVIA